MGFSKFNRDPISQIREFPGVGQKLAKRIIQELGDGDSYLAIALIEQNPFSLIDVDGIGFSKADRIARESFDLSQDDPRRHRAGNRFVLEQRGVLPAREYFAERVKIGLNNAEYQDLGVELEENRYWLPEELEAELGLEGWMRGMGMAAPIRDLTDVQVAICERLGLDVVQARALEQALSERVLCLTGGAGCGKTHVVAALAQCALSDRKSIRGMAFAGKAADRMREAFDADGIEAEASTIHKALGYQKRGFTVEVLAEDLIVIDEASMLPNWLLWAVVSRMKPGATLVLVGDPNQLPPIGYGTPFTDLIKHGCPRAHLSRNYRQADQQGILHMAEGILQRRRPAPAECVEMHLNTLGAALESLFDELVGQHGGTDYEAWQVITYTNEVAERYNLRAQAVINPDGVALFEYPLWKLGTGERNRPLHHAEIRTGDKIIVVKNSTLLNIFNGQTGRVVGLVHRPKRVNRKGPDGRWEESPGDMMPHLRIEITGRPVDIPEDEVEKFIQLGYIITVHKAQGSDWNRVIVMQPGKVRDDTARRFFYTSCTRAKDHLVIVSTLRTVAWWTNAATAAPDEPSSLMVRLGRPAPEIEGCGPGNYCDMSIRPEYWRGAALILGKPQGCSDCGDVGELAGGYCASCWQERREQEATLAGDAEMAAPPSRSCSFCNDSGDACACNGGVEQAQRQAAYAQQPAPPSISPEPTPQAAQEPAAAAGQWRTLRRAQVSNPAEVATERVRAAFRAGMVG